MSNSVWHVLIIGNLESMKYCQEENHPQAYHSESATLTRLCIFLRYFFFFHLFFGGAGGHIDRMFFSALCF